MESHIQEARVELLENLANGFGAGVDRDRQIPLGRQVADAAVGPAGVAIADRVGDGRGGRGGVAGGHGVFRQQGTAAAGSLSRTFASRARPEATRFGSLLSISAAPSSRWSTGELGIGLARLAGVGKGPIGLGE